MRRNTVLASPELDSQWRWYQVLPLNARPKHPKTGTGRIVPGRGTTLKPPTGALADWMREHCPQLASALDDARYVWRSGMFR
jgi:hypothetical protein